MSVRRKRTPKRLQRQLDEALGGRVDVPRELLTEEEQEAALERMEKRLKQALGRDKDDG